ncbi:hypothetical protein A2U01_0075016, partial [Trifolium medium]|nr:hypothetical protein [Trifolium medium]
PVEEGLYSAPCARPKVSIMGRVYPPIMDDCQGFSLNEGISSSCSSPWVKAAPLIKDKGYIFDDDVSSDEEHVVHMRVCPKWIRTCSFGLSSTS